ncbi:MAG: endonuclease Q family protein [bacterium]|nr:endonuclease Q family protein [bacterium]
MKINADLHIHSYFSIATSKSLNLENIYKWAQLKGLQVVGTGDFTHPGWLSEIKEKLEPAEDGLFKLKPRYAQAIQTEIYPKTSGLVRFIITGEISCIYKKNERVRKIHNIVTAPDLKIALKIQKALDKIGNISADGRPILGLDARHLLEIVLESNPQAYLIPAHIWTPWFSLLGSKSGFDCIEECFEDLSNHIFALETGLSSDPAMNWRVSSLDKYTLVSNSDAHSPEKLGREATLLDTNLSYQDIFKALQTENSKSYLGTVEFFPEKGKYHYDGHRKCQVRLDPQTTNSYKEICPVCGKKVTVGVMSRVEELADRPQEKKPINAFPYYRLVPLREILAEIKGIGSSSKSVQKTYLALLSSLGPELDILMNIPVEEIDSKEGTVLGEAIRRMRKGKINSQPGYDGEFGVIKIFEEDEKLDNRY